MHLCGHACDLTKRVADEVLNSKNAADAIISAIHKSDPLTVVATVYGELIKLIATERNSNETNRDLELQFYAEISRSD